jgi:hypothetical protein
MEFWTGSPQLIDWTTNSYPLTMPPYDPYIVRQDTNSHSGKYAATFFGNGILTPTATTTFPLGNQSPTHLRFWYRLLFPPCVNDPGFTEKDTAFVRLDILHQGQVVQTALWQSTLSQLDYTPVYLPVPAVTSSFDSCRITLLGGKVYGGCGFAPAGTAFSLDDLALRFAADCVDSGAINLNAICPLVFDPVCGCNGVTYGNACEALNYGGVLYWTPGECPPTTGNGCSANFTHTKQTDTITFTNTSTASALLTHRWTFGDGDSSSFFNPTHIYAAPGWYEVCLTITGLDSLNSACSDTHCDSIYVSDGCIDSSLICPPGSLCCDAPLDMSVCGCDGVTYMNACVATLFGGVLSSTPGSCDSLPSGIGRFSPALQLRLSPNPAANESILSFTTTQAAAWRCTISSLLGATVLSQDLGPLSPGAHRLSLPIASLAKGIYLLGLHSEGQSPKLLKLIKE